MAMMLTILYHVGSSRRSSTSRTAHVEISSRSFRVKTDFCLTPLGYSTNIPSEEENLLQLNFFSYILRGRTFQDANRVLGWSTILLTLKQLFFAFLLLFKTRVMALL